MLNLFNLRPDNGGIKGNEEMVLKPFDGRLNESKHPSTSNQLKSLDPSHHVPGGGYRNAIGLIKTNTVSKFVRST